MPKSIPFFLVTFSKLLNAAEPELGVFKWSGDLRYRHEFIQSEGSTPAAYHQHKLMFRAGAKVAMHSNADAEFRVATGTGRTTVNQTLGGGFSNIGMGLDRAFFTWRPIENLNVLGGRVKNTFFSPKGSDLVWDSDLNFDGLSATYACDCAFKPFVTGTFYWVNKVTTADKMDNHLLTLQVGGNTKISDISFAAGVAVYQYTNTTTQTSIDSTFKGNTSSGTGATATYATNFNVINPGVELGLTVAEMPVTLTGDLALNPAASSESLGFLVGVALGESKKKGDWKFSYDYRQLKADCTIAAFTDGDSFAGGTDGRSHRVKVTYRILDPLQFGATAFVGAKNISDGATAVDRHRGQLDLVWSL